MSSRIYIWLQLACALSWTFAATSSQAFILPDPSFQPWMSTASGSRIGNGRPVTLTWSVAGDGTSTPDENGLNRVGSNLISFMDSTFGGAPAGNPNDLTARPWFGLFQQTFDRWEELSGIDFVYEPNDDAASLPTFPGQLNARGDIRLSGRDIDGPGGTLALNYFPSIGDMIIDTSEAGFYGNASNNYLRFRNTVAHELGHGLGLEHLISGTDALLLEPSIGLSFDGPQLDEVRAVHYFYGDVYEKSFNGLGNDAASQATDLGTILAGETARIGSDADVPSQLISANATDFVSISNLNDSDYFSFTVGEAGLLDAVLTPHGGSFTQGPVTTPPTAPAFFNADARSDLSLTIFDTNGVTPLVTIDSTGLGSSETLQDFSLLEAGEYFARVTGADDTIQLYELELSFSTPVFADADFNQDTNVGSADLEILQSALGINAAGDADGDGDTDGADLLIWQQQYTGDFQTLEILETVPEPSSAVVLLLALAIANCRIR